MINGLHEVNKYFTTTVTIEVDNNNRDNTKKYIACDGLLKE